MVREVLISIHDLKLSNGVEVAVHDEGSRSGNEETTRTSSVEMELQEKTF
jgi:hypothetical protein